MPNINQSTENTEPNTTKYKRVFRKLHENPKLKAATVCREENASYPGFRYWSARLTPQEKAEILSIGRSGINRETTTNSHTPIFIGIPLSKLAAAFVGKDAMVSISMATIKRTLTAEQLRAILDLIHEGRQSLNDDGGNT